MSLRFLNQVQTRTIFYLNLRLVTIGYQYVLPFRSR